MSAISIPSSFARRNRGRVAASAVALSLVSSAFAGATVAHADEKPADDSRGFTFSKKAEYAVPGEYRVDITSDGRLFVTGAGSTKNRAPVQVTNYSVVAEINPQTLQIKNKFETNNVERDVVASPTPFYGDWIAKGNFGMDVDEANGNIWTSSTRLDKLFVYDEGLTERKKEITGISHPRDILVVGGFAYVTAANLIHVYDTKTFEEVKVIDLGQRTDYYNVADGKLVSVKDRYATNLKLVDGKLYTPDLSTNEVHVIDPATNTVVRTYEVPTSMRDVELADGSKVRAYAGSSAITADADPERNELYVATQNDGVWVLNLATGQKVQHFEKGDEFDSSISIAVDRKRHLAYFGDFNTGFVKVYDSVTGSLQEIGNVDQSGANAGKVNHLTIDPKTGDVYAVDKTRTGKLVTVPSLVNKNADAGAGTFVDDQATANSITKFSVKDPEAPVAPAAATSVSVKVSSAKYNYAPTLSVSVKAKGSSATPTGKVTVTVSGKTYSAKLSKGKAKITLDKRVSAGKKSVSVSYKSSNADAFKNSSAKTSFTVKKGSVKVSAKASKSSVKVSAKVAGNLKAKASSLKVQVFDGKKKIKSAKLDKAGKATVKLPKLKKGTHKISVKVIGNDNLTSAKSATQTVKVKK